MASAPNRQGSPASPGPLAVWPTTREESWRYFPTRPLEHHALDRPMGPVTLPPELAPVVAHARLVLVNGALVASTLPDGVTLDDVEPEPDEATDGLTAANRTHARPVGLRVARDVASPLIEVLHVALGDGVAHARLSVRLEARASLGLLQRFVGRGAYLVNAHLAARVGPDARLDHVKILDEDAAAAHVERVAVEVDRDGRYHGFVLSLGGARARTAPTVKLRAPGADAEVDGLYLGAGEQVLDHTARIEHLAPHTGSRATWAGVLDGRATGTFQGNVTMANDAVKARTRELTRTLLLSPTAVANAKPELRIDVDDVEASHGASVGSLDPAQLFYLAARGVAPDDARRMLIGAFVAETVALAPPRLRAFVDEALASRVLRAVDPGDVGDDGGGDDAAL